VVVGFQAKDLELIIQKRKKEQLGNLEMVLQVKVIGEEQRILLYLHQVVLGIHRHLHLNLLNMKQEI